MKNHFVFIDCKRKLFRGFLVNKSDSKPFTLSIRDLTEYKVNKVLQNALRGAGYKQLREIQSKAVKSGLFDNVSLFVCSPSGSGKTLIGEMAAVNNILNKKGKSIYLVPLRALAGEKKEYFIETYAHLGIKVVMAVGDQYVQLNELKQADLLIMTFEKFDSYMRVINENQWIHKIRTVIVDEIHIIGESHRGPRLESLLLRIYLRLTEFQLIGLSATMANHKEVGDWFYTLNEIFAKRK
ncbi:MAG: DEAD/DEAH box helicase, partial [Candidatus Lokiarchaeota archaeon]|nr:DEAD/DEAH box helicase [Candidatus Lokiarchaeota archaeon]